MGAKKNDSEDGRLLSPSAYQKLQGQVQKLFTSADQASSRARVEANWTIGERIVGARLSRHAGYHNSVLRDLSSDTGISVRVLQEAVAFRESYEEVPDYPNLGWSHYRKLIQLPEAGRAQLSAAANENRWSARDLQAAIADFVELEEGAPPALRRPTDPTYLYAARITDIIDGDTVHADIDLGFAVTRHEKLRLAHIDTPESKSPKGRAAKTYLTRLLHRAATLAITTESTDLHGRYLAHLFTTEVPATTLECFEKGLHINARLVSAKHAVVKKR